MTFAQYFKYEYKRQRRNGIWPFSAFLMAAIYAAKPTPF